MAAAGNRGFAAKVLFASAGLMTIAALLVWTGAIPVSAALRTYLPIILGAVAAIDLVLGVFFAKDGR